MRYSCYMSSVCNLLKHLHLYVSENCHSLVWLGRHRCRNETYIWSWNGMTAHPREDEKIISGSNDWAWLMLSQDIRILFPHFVAIHSSDSSHITLSVWMCMVTSCIVFSLTLYQAGDRIWSLHWIYLPMPLYDFSKPNSNDQADPLVRQNSKTSKLQQLVSSLAKRSLNPQMMKLKHNLKWKNAKERE